MIDKTIINALKSLLVFFVFAIILNAITYGAVAFVVWKPTPDLWSWDERYTCMTLFVLEWILLAFVVGYINLIINLKKVNNQSTIHGNRYK